MARHSTGSLSTVEDACAAPLGSIPLFQYERGSTFGHDEPVAVAVEWAGRSGGIVVAAGEHPDDVEGAKGEGREGCFHTTGEHSVGAPVPDKTRGLADGDRAGGAGVGIGHRGASQSELDGDVTGGGPAEDRERQHRRDGADTAIDEGSVLFFGKSNT